MALDLESIFGESPAVQSEAAVVTGELTTTVVSEKATLVVNGTTTAVDEEDIAKGDEESITTGDEERTSTVDEFGMDTPAADGTLEVSTFADWVLRPDATGRMGWERPDVPEGQRWWADSTFEELPEARPPCPTCGGVLWWEDLEGGRHCLDCDRAKFEQGRELLRVAQRLRPASGLSSPQQAEVEAKPPTPGQLRCDRCKSTQLVEATTHGGRTVRLDCARCGRFVAWKSWYGKLLVENGN